MPIMEKFKKLWKFYTLQSILAAITIYIIAIIFSDSVLIIASMGATAFICFALPKAASAQTIHVIGGHVTGLACGAIFALTPLPLPLEFALAVGLAIFIMVAIDVEHPPAVGTALAVVINEVELSGAIAIMLSVLVITQCRYLLRNVLKDLI